jgi:methylase of polypeptide subunit release factors
LPEEKLEPKDSALSTTGGKKGNEILERFLKEAKDHLNKNGKILIVVSSLTPNVENLIKKYNYEFKKLSEQKIPFETLTVYLIGTTLSEIK